MHLLIIGGSPDHQGGVEAFCERSAIALNRRGSHEIEYFATGNAFMKLRGIPKLLRGLRHMLSYRGKQLDCVWVQYASLPDLIYAFVAKRAGFKVMITPHLGSNWRSQKVAALRALSKWLLRSADRLALISPTQELEIALPAGVPRSPIRNFLPAGILEGSMADLSQRPPDTLQIIHSGRLSEGKGTFMVVELCARLKQAGKPFATTITGTADEATMARLHAMIAQHGLQDDITVTGRVSEEALFGYLRGSDVLVHLSSIDSYPLIVLEATACSVFPVCMELAGARDMVETYDGVIVSVDHAVDETVAALIDADVTELRARAAQVATRVRADYAWDNCARALEQALKACVG
ncbi:glycosyltransferase family 4 protein [Sphingobium aquiterrae]|uniref:glycosyltransferase family 4 protein n=1 Tax=Sphingobium aquiterrae TaxID=2038656 RepID=UPI00301912EF